MKERRYICEACNYSWTKEEHYLEDEELIGDNHDQFDTNGDYEDLQNSAHSLEEVEEFEEIQSCPMCGSINTREL